MATVTFPNSNLPVASQPWGRTVEKQLVDLSLTVNSNEINNAARDKQLLASLNRTNATAISAQAAADAANAALADIGAVKTNIYVPGTTLITGTAIKSGTISADKISAGTLTGFTIQTAASGQRVEMYGSGIYFYSPTYVGSMVGSTKNGYQIIDITGGGLNVAGPIWTLNTLNAAAMTNLTAGVTITGDVQHNGGNMFINGGYLQNIDTYNRNVQQGRIMYVASNGTYNAATSSARYKQDIQSYSVDAESFFKLRPVSFRYKMAVAEQGDDAAIAHGFIAEEAAEAGLTEFVDFEPDENGNLRPDNFRYIDFTAAMYSVIKDMNTRLETLENK